MFGTNLAVSFCRAIGRECFLEVIYMRFIKVDKLAKGVVELVKAVAPVDGFDGWIGLCFGHQRLARKQIEAAKSAPKPAAPMGLEQYLEKASKESTTMTIPELLEAWRKESAKPEVVSVGTKSDTSCISSVTNSPVRHLSCVVRFLMLPRLTHSFFSVLECRLFQHHQPCHHHCHKEEAKEAGQQSQHQQEESQGDNCNCCCWSISINSQEEAETIELRESWAWG